MRKVIEKLSLLIHTIRYLKFRQLFYQVYYTLFSGKFRLSKCEKPVVQLELLAPHYPYGYVLNNNGKYTFSFLNQEKEFEEKLNWSFSDYGKLWTFNLNYFDFLSDKQLSDAIKQELMLDYLPSFDINSIGKASYTISLRAYNWIKYINSSKWEDERVIQHLFSQYHFLYQRFEYHILANHLLENALSLLFGACFFSDNKFYAKAKYEIVKELNEQICEDGCHYERSVMYHSILLGRMIEATYLLKNNPCFKDEEFTKFIEHKTSLMLGFLEKIKFDSDEIPMFNDAIRGLCYSPSDLFAMAKEAKIISAEVSLSDSGYRKVVKPDYELLVDVGGVQPSYQPGHTHADSFSFELYCRNKPLIVDVGTSTYENNDIRHYERSTFAHNTVALENRNQSQVWGGFRVAKRVKVEVRESLNKIEGICKSYFSSIEHKRMFLFDDKSFVIHDTIDGFVKNVSLARIHFHPDIIPIQLASNVYNVDDVEIVVEGAESVILEDYEYALAFNKRVKAKCLVIKFKKRVSTVISIIK